MATSPVPSVVFSSYTNLISLSFDCSAVLCVLHVFSCSPSSRTSFLNCCNILVTSHQHHGSLRLKVQSLSTTLLTNLMAMTQYRVNCHWSTWCRGESQMLINNSEKVMSTTVANDGWETWWQVGWEGNTKKGCAPKKGTRTHTQRTCASSKIHARTCQKIYERRK